MSLEYLFDAELHHRPGMEPVVGPEESARYRAYARVDGVPPGASRRLDLEAAG